MWISIVALNDKTRKEVTQHQKLKKEEKKRAMNAIGKDSSEFQEPEDDTKDAKFEKNDLGFPLSYGDEEGSAYWRNKAVNLNKLIESHLDQLDNTR